MDVQMLCEFHSDVPQGITVVVITIMAIIIIIIKSAEGLLHKLTFFLSIRYQPQRVLLYWTRTFELGLLKRTGGPGFLSIPVQIPTWLPLRSGPALSCADHR